MTRRIAVLLTVFNRKECTLRCLRQLVGQRLPEGLAYDVYITDGGSTDGTVESVHEEFPDAHIEVREGVYWNRGMWTSWETAARTCDYDYYLWLNDDTFLYDVALSVLVDGSVAKEDKCIIVGATVDTATKQKWTYGGKRKQRAVPLRGELEEVDYFNGNIVLIPSYVYRRLGNLDYYYTHSKGDFDYGIRARKAGIRMYQAGKALGECDVHPRIDRWCDPEVPLRTRWRLLNRPNGMPPKEIFHLEKQESIAKASFHYLTVILRCLFPSMWIK